MSIVLQGSTSGSVTLQEPAVAGTTVLTLPAVSGTVITSNGSGDIQFNSGYGSVATAYGCRAWVNFNGSGTPAIRASGNVTSITDNGTGDYTVNFTTAMPDANYATNLSIGSITGGSSDVIPLLSTLSTTSVRVLSVQAVFRDAAYVGVAIFR
jgi:hypothetical protein